MKKDIIRTSALALTLALGAAVATPGAAQPATLSATAQSASSLPASMNYQPGQVYLVAECDPVSHKDFCYCTGACSGH